MQETQILSTRPLPPESGRHARRPNASLGHALVFDACQVGVVLRAVLFVETMLGVGAMFGAGSPVEWLARMALLTGGALPATLAWLITACSLKGLLQRLDIAQQYTAGVLLGALAGLYACAMLALVGVAPAPPWLVSAASGALLAALLVTALVLRARGRTPATTAARLAELQSRIRPHFLFNTLNSAIALVREEPAKAESLLEDLSELFRHALVEQGESVTLAEEITLAQRYLGIEAVRFGERLQVQWSLDPRADTACLPPLLLQPLVENAVKHGVEPSPRGGKLRVQTELRGSRVLVHITNTLPVATAQDKNHSRGHGIALANVRARLALLHDLQSEFSAGIQDGLYQVRITPCPRPARPPTPDPMPSPEPSHEPICLSWMRPGAPRSHPSGEAQKRRKSQISCGFPGGWKRSTEEDRLNILLVDDEALARSRLRTLLADCSAGMPQTLRHTVAEAATTAEALALLGPTGGRAFDLLLLDIHMPGQDGLCLAQRLKDLPHPPAVVFVTAHPGHALSAFELDAIDYLTKPVRRERLQQALAKVQRAAGQRPVHAPATPAAPEGETLLLQDRGRTERLPLAEVLYFKAEQKYVTVRTATRSYVLDGALSELEGKYAVQFLRIHRNALVARRAVRALEKHFDPEEGEGWAVRLQGLTELLAVSRRQVAAVREELAR